MLNDIASQRINEIICLGDLVGYGPDPRACIDMVMKSCRITTMGNHDVPTNWENGWTSREVSDPGDLVQNQMRRAFLAHLPQTYEIGPYLFVHGSPRNPLGEYVSLRTSTIAAKWTGCSRWSRRYCFQGHTHVPGVITEEFQHFSPEEINDRYDLGATKVMVNVGSVGQPRNGDDRACYVILDDGPIDDIGPDVRQREIGVSSPRIAFRRLPFDFRTTIRKMRDSG